MEKHRVKFYSTSDLIYGYMANKAIEVLKVLDENTDSYTLDDILELHNIYKYAEISRFPKDFPEEDKKYFGDSYKKKINKIINIYATKISNENVVDLTKNLYPQYNEDFWIIVVKYKVYERITNETFKKLLQKFHLLGILAHKALVVKYDNEITEEFLSNPQHIGILISKYLRKNKEHIIHLPKIFTLDKKEEFILKYIESDSAHINTLELLARMQPQGDFNISDDTRAKALERRDELATEFFKQDKGIHIESNLKVSYSETQEEPIIQEYKDFSLSCSIGEKWIDENLDYATLLNNFIHIFSLVDNEQRISYLSKPNQAGLFERIFSSRDYIKHYEIDSVFSMFNKFIIIQIVSYCEYLKIKHNLRVENIIEWFFDTYLKEEFNVEGFIVHLPSEGSTYLEKCRTICCEMEGLLKQFDSFVKYGKVRHNVIETSSTPIEVGHVKSFCKQKYFYPTGGECNNIMNLLFSDQTMLSYLSKREQHKEYDNLFRLMYEDVVNIDEYEDYQKQSLQYLIDKNIIRIDKQGFLRFVNIDIVVVLYDLYNNGFATTMCYKQRDKLEIVEDLAKKGWIYFSNGLLSKQETDYFNYYLNRADFANGLDLRNTYLHGAQRKKGSDTDLHKVNYYTLLMLYIILVIKINEEFCVREMGE